MRRQHGLLRNCSIWLGAVFSILVFEAQRAHACDISTSENEPVRQIVSCGDRVTIEREPTADLQLTKSPDTVAPRVIEVQGGAILINVSSGQAPTQVRTPHAIATVRGTTYIVDAGPSQTSVFVLEGAVDVRRTNDASTFTLTAGEGTDVSLDAPLTVSRWSADRAEALLGRFGR